ncbi:MAG: immune inhibitor A [Anaerolineae bacterium]|nr:immune inhibitor A [Anaerolineae bacterium]
MSSSLTCVVVVLVLLLACALLVCCAAGAMIAWEMYGPPDVLDPITGPPPHPTAAPPITGAPDAVALMTEARLNAAVIPPHDPVALYAALAPDAAGSPLPPAAPQYRVGDRRSFRMDGASVSAELIHATEHTYVWLVDGVRADRQALIAAGDRFESHIYPAVRRAFGSEWSPGIDSDPHISILHYYDQDDDAAGYFSPWDELPRWIDTDSNEAEMFYINLDGMDPGEEFYYAVLAHEFQHMIHWHLDRNEADWLDEGLAELACRISGFDPGSSDELFYAQPDTQLNDWPYEDDTTIHYGSGYLFALYLWEHFGDTFIWDLTHRPEDGLAALDATLATHTAGLSADEVFAHWVVVNAINDGEYGYIHEGLKVDLHVDASHANYPVSRSTTVFPYATDYVELTGTGTLGITFQGDSQTELLPVTPRTGATAWWSNEGNRSDARLTHRFDLAGLSSATLRFWAWYDLERSYDYVYLSASRDGQTWQVVQTERATHHADYGPAYNGQSGGWVEEVVDLSRYAGSEVWVRFDHVTDDSINGVGFLIDDVSIPELGFADTCDDEGGWQAEGFVLVGPTIPQRWAVQVIEFPTGGGQPQVRRMAVDGGQGSIDVTLGSGVERAVMAVSALARGTQAPASYLYEITRR